MTLTPLTNSFVYDLNGNLLTNGNEVFIWNDENELISVYVTNAWREDFTYDGLWRRRIETNYTWSGGTWLATNAIRFIYDGNVVIQERDGSNNPLVTYTRGNDLSGSLQGAGGIGGLLARTDNQLASSGSQWANSYYHADGAGNVTGLIYTNQPVGALYEYDPYGNLLSMAGPLASANVYRYSSKAWDENAGIYYYLYRFYDPNLQRWLNQDPIQEMGGVNLYQFANNNAENKIDPEGLWQLTIQFGAGLGLRFTIGNNGGNGLLNGQWNGGAYIGVGEGFSADLDIYNRGCHEKGANWGAEGAGDIGLGPHVEGETHLGSDSWWNVSGGFGDSPLGASYGTDGATVPTIGFGESAVVGGGGTFYY